MVNVLNAFVGTPPIDGGVFFRAPVGTPLPTDALTPLHAAFGDHGAVGESGITVAQTRDNTDIPMMGGKTFINVQTKYDEQITIDLLEDDNEAVLKTAFGDANVIVTPATSAKGTQKVIYHTADSLPISSFVVAAISGKKTKRYVIELGQVVSVGEVKDLHSDVTRRTLTVKTYAPTSVELKGGNVVEYRDDGVKLTAKTVTFAGGPFTAGTFTLTVGGQTTAALAFNATAAAIKTALELLSTVGTDNATVTGTIAAGLEITVPGALSGSGSGLTPSGTITVS